MRSDLVAADLRRWSAILAGSVIVAGYALGVPGAALAVGEHGKAQIVAPVWGDALAPTGHAYAADLDPGSLFAVTSAIGARSVWQLQDAAGRAITGQGVTVALLDSGAQAVPGLDAPGKIVRGPDLSLESVAGSASGDTFGHGTHLAGIIAAKDPGRADPQTGAPDATDASKQLGVAPDAGLLALKLATTDGSTDVSQVIAALDWVAQHRTDDGMNVRVVNLSFGTASLQAYQVDPLAAAAEHAWLNGLVVVVSGGNGGPGAGRLTDPAIDPYVIAVGASDPDGTGWRSPSVAGFSSRGTAQRHVDLVAPGRSITALRAPGSFVDVTHPEGLVPGDTTGRLFRGSGTSQAAAVVSGAAALVLQANPTLTPDQVKNALVSTARPLAGAVALDAGAGQLDVRAAVAVATKATQARQTWPVATGLGSLDAARGGSHLVDQTGGVLVGEVDVLGTPWDPAAWSVASASGLSWHGGQWMRARWSDALWSRARWSDTSWDRARWSRARWSDTSWDRARWSDVSWDRARWSRARWSDASWERARWSSAGWGAAVRCQ